MSELVPSPEEPVEPKEKIRVKCWHCEKAVQSSLENCFTTVFTKQPWNSYTALGCLDKECQAVIILFHDQLDEKTAAKAMQYPTYCEEFCDQADIMEVRRNLMGAVDLESYEVSERQSKVIEHWGAFLQAIVVDLSDFPEQTPYCREA